MTAKEVFKIIYDLCSEKERLKLFQMIKEKEEGPELDLTPKKGIKEQEILEMQHKFIIKHGWRK